VFTRRGIIEVHAFKTGAAIYSRESVLHDEDKTRLLDLSRSDGLYRLRVGKRTSDHSVPTNYVYTFIKACSLYESRLSETITIHVDQSGGLIAASVSSPTPFCTPGTSHRELADFNTTVEVQQTVNGPAPDTQAYIQKIEHEKMEKAKGQQADNRSFFVKNWMYIVPVVLFMMVMSSSVDPNAGQGGGAR